MNFMTYFGAYVTLDRGETRYALVVKNCFLFYLIINLREGNQARFELFSNIF